MSAIPEHVLAQQKAALESIVGVQSALLGGFERLVNLNMQVLKATFEEGSEHVRRVASAKDPQEAVAYAGSVLGGTDKAVSYSRHVYDIAQGVQSELSQLQEEHLRQRKALLDAAFEQLVKQAPPGSEGAVALMKTSLATAHSAFEAATHSARQAAEQARSNVQAATHATFNAASSAAETIDTVAARQTRAA